MRPLSIAMVAGTLGLLATGRVLAQQPAPAANGPADEDTSLRQDPRLQITLTATFRFPTIAVILAALEERTGLPFAPGADLLDVHRPLGNMTFQNAPAWKVMEEVARTQVVEGRWIQAQGGYWLTGKAMVPFRGKLPPPAPAQSVRPLNRWLVWSTVGLAAVAAILGGLLMRRRLSVSRAKEPRPACSARGPSSR